MTNNSDEHSIVAFSEKHFLVCRAVGDLANECHQPPDNEQVKQWAYPSNCLITPEPFAYSGMNPFLARGLSHQRERWGLGFGRLAPKTERERYLVALVLDGILY